MTECNGKGLKPVLHCNFENDFCGFTQSGFQWIRTKGKQASNKRPEIPFDGYPPGSSFVYSNSSYSTEVYGKGNNDNNIILKPKLYYIIKVTFTVIYIVLLLK